jgi:NADH dehydrogenase FAD-containing subunit
MPGVGLVLVSPQALAPYSGMVPGWLAGRHRFDDIVIDFQHLCAAAGARWVQDELHALNADQQQLQLGSGEVLDYDGLSLNLGSTLKPPPVDTPMLSLRPLADLREAYDAVLARWVDDRSPHPFTVTAVGGGAAGVESLLAVLARLRSLRPDRRVLGALVTSSATVLPDLSAAARRAALRALARADVTLQLGTAWSSAWAQGSDPGSNLLLWATGAQAHAWQRDPARRGTLAVSPAGFVCIDAQLRSTSHPQVFAAGDCAEWSQPLPKAGVYAVRMGPVLAHNLRAALGEGPLQTYRPQAQFLVLLNTADGRAIASRSHLGAQGRWALHWKDWIDRRFVARFAPIP